MIGNSETVSPVFIQFAPDWSKPIQLVTEFSTSISETRNEGRQRARQRYKPRYAFSYQIIGLNIPEFSQRRAALISELKAPIVVPIWTDAFTLDSMTSATVADLGVALAKEKFKSGSYAYFVQSGKESTFRKITAIGSETLTFESASVPTFTNGAAVYPCILGFRPKNSASSTLLNVNQTDETINIEEL